MHSIAPTLLSHLKLYLTQMKMDLGAFSTSTREAHLSIQAKPELDLGQRYMLRKSQLLRSSLCRNSRFSISSILVGCCASSKKYP